MAGRIFETYDITPLEYSRYLTDGKKELAFILNEERFLMYRNCNNKFKKHLGFTLEFVKFKPENIELKYKVVIFDKTKLMLFKIKYGL
jgi:hypothetical protein